MKLQLIIEALETIQWVESAFKAYKFYLFGSARYGVLRVYPDKRTFRICAEDKRIIQKTVAILKQVGFSQE